MAHFLERHHNERFKAYIEQFMPQWRLHRDELNRAPLSHETRSYGSGVLGEPIRS